MAEAFKNSIAQSLECAVCLTTFTDPKILSCSHTYCKACLENLLQCHGNDTMIRCPVCRAEAPIPNQDVSKLPTNLALKHLIEDMIKERQICTNCESGNKPHAVVYCQDCREYFCTACHNAHSHWKGFISHEVIAVTEISSEKLSLRRFRKCRKHPKEDEECFCSDCRRFACFRCVVMEHKDEGHRIIEAAAYERNHTESIDDLKSKVDQKRLCYQKYVDFIDEQKKRVGSAHKKCADDISKAYTESVKQLREKNDILLGEVKGITEKAEKELDEMKQFAQKQINYLGNMADMVTNRSKVPIDTDTLAAHDTLCGDIQKALDLKNPDYEHPKESSKKGISVSFRRRVGMNELGLGNIVNDFAKCTFAPLNKECRNQREYTIGTLLAMEQQQMEQQKLLQEMRRIKSQVLDSSPTYTGDD